MELLEQVHGDKGQQAVFRCADAVTLIFFGHGFIFLLMGAITGEHRPPLSAAPLRGVFAGKAIRWRVPASLRVYSQQLPTPMSQPVDALHLRTLSCSRGPTAAWNYALFFDSPSFFLLQK